MPRAMAESVSGELGGAVMRKPPVFIALLDVAGETFGYVRADQIDVVATAAADEPLLTHVHTISGVKMHTRETVADVFAKMADALNVEDESEAP